MTIVVIDETLFTFVHYKMKMRLTTYHKQSYVRHLVILPHFVCYSVF